MFCQFLDERAMTIDIWDGDTLMHFGQVKVPLYLLMRQGEPMKVIGQEFEVLNSDNGSRIGSLQLMLLNQGRKIARVVDDKPSKRQEQSHNSKIDQSKPIDVTQETLNELVAKEKANMNLALDEDMRKKRRVERLRQMGITSQVKADPSSDWEKMEQLKQIQLIREAQKKDLVNKVSMSSEVRDQRTVNVTSGQPFLIELEVSNPFDRKHVFKVELDDEDYKNGHIKNHEVSLIDNSKQEWDHWCGQGKVQKPNTWKTVNAETSTVTLEGREICSLLFKFQSFRQPQLENMVEGNGDQANELRPRAVKIDIMND